MSIGKDQKSFVDLTSSTINKSIRPIVFNYLSSGYMLFGVRFTLYIKVSHFFVNGCNTTNPKILLCKICVFEEKGYGILLFNFLDDTFDYTQYGYTLYDNCFWGKEININNNNLHYMTDEIKMLNMVNIKSSKK